MGLLDSVTAAQGRRARAWRPRLGAGSRARRLNSSTGARNESRDGCDSCAGIDLTANLHMDYKSIEPTEHSGL
jgi:hypothetical protein